LENITGQDVLARSLDGLPIQGAIKVLRDMEYPEEIINTIMEYDNDSEQAEEKKEKPKKPRKSKK
jgi:hypothetical protein